MDSITLSFSLFATAAISLFLFKFVFSAGHSKLPLPPGTLGWPYIGETFQLYSQNPNTFFASKLKK